MKKFLATILTLSPSFVFAQPLTDINTVAQKATNIGNLLVSLAISFAVIWIIISVVRYLIAGGEEDRKKGGWAVFYGVLGLFLILSIWGLVYLLRNSFRFGNNTAPTYNEVRITPPPIVP